MDPLAHLQQPHSAPSSSSSAAAAFAASAPAASPSAPAQPLVVVSHETSHQQLDAADFGVPFDFDRSPASLGPEQQQHFPSLSPGVDSTDARSSSFSSAPALTLSSDPDLDFFDTAEQAYTPSYANSIADYSSAASAAGDDLFDDISASGKPASFYDPSQTDDYAQFAASLPQEGGYPIPAPIAESVAEDDGFTAFLQQQHAQHLAQQQLAQYAQFQEPHASLPAQQALSPFASPLLSASSHGRASSFGSQSDAGFDLSQHNLQQHLQQQQQQHAQGSGLSAEEEAWMQSLGQRITLDDQPPQAPAAERKEFRFPPVFEGEEGGSTAGQQQQSQQPHQHQHTPSVPVLSLNDSAMDTSSHNPGPSHGHGHGRALSADAVAGGFHSVPHPAPSSQPAWPMDGINAGHDRRASSSNDLPSTSHDDSAFSATPAPSSMAPPSAHVSSGAGEEPARQDSYEKIRKFLKLDVDIGFLTSPKNSAGGFLESPTGSGLSAWRKRSNSDVGPRSPVDGPVRAGSGLWNIIPGGVTDKTPTATTAGIDWAFETAKIRQAKLQGVSVPQSQSPLVVSAMQTDTLNPNHLAQNEALGDVQMQQMPKAEQFSSPAPVLSPMPAQHFGLSDATVSPMHAGSDDLSGTSSPSSLGPVRREHGSASGRSSGMPYHVRASSHTSSGSSSRPSALAALSPHLGGPTAFAWQSKPASPLDNTSALRRSQTSAREARPSPRHRSAQSEDLSNMARAADPADYLARVTAPDGSLAPPGGIGGPMAPGNNGAPPGAAGFYAGVGSRGGHPYRVSHDRHHSWGSNTSNSSAGSPGPDGSAGHLGASPMVAPYHPMHNMQPPPPPPPPFRPMQPEYAQQQPMPTFSRQHSNQYSQTAAPTYGALSPPVPSAPSASAAVHAVIPPPRLPLDGEMVPIATVTTSATQAASASRRTNAAVHYCPIPGCNSSFTRKFNLNGHLRSHTGDKPFECGECGKKFARHFDLSRHERLHSGIKAHTCETCGKNFARIDALRRHLRTDGGAGVGCAARAGSMAAGGSSPGDQGSDAPSPNGRFVGAAM